MRELERGEVVLAPDPYSGKDGYRPFVIISDENYPFHPFGYLGVPVTTRDKSNTVQIHEHDKQHIKAGLDVDPSFVNPYSPVQVNEAGQTLTILTDEFMDTVSRHIIEAIGVV